MNAPLTFLEYGVLDRLFPDSELCWDLAYIDTVLKELDSTIRLGSPYGEVQEQEQEQDQLQMSWKEERSFIMEDDHSLRSPVHETVKEETMLSRPSTLKSPKKRSSSAHPEDRNFKHPKKEVKDENVSQEIQNSEGLRFLRGYIKFITGIEKKGHRTKLPLNTDSPRPGRNNLYNKILSDDPNAVVEMIESSVWIKASEDWIFQLQKIDGGFGVWECTKCPKEFYLQFEVRVTTEEEKIGSVVVGPLQSFRSKPTKDCDRKSIAESKMIWSDNKHPLEGQLEWKKINMSMTV
eukprot:TRINITY_DN5565_c0_g3_i1.p1 TRINITY_DN5565_c0_g3~~TRINITY_DN5565_c0_g3_i1.p1  ORF type:complete len:292 (-),score=61.55 TRINITY_DN5565_c0_g3_i1:154-1029(-)